MPNALLGLCRFSNWTCCGSSARVQERATWRLSAAGKSQLLLPRAALHALLVIFFPACSSPRLSTLQFVGWLQLGGKRPAPRDTLWLETQEGRHRRADPLRNPEACSTVSCACCCAAQRWCCGTLT